MNAIAHKDADITSSSESRSFSVSPFGADQGLIIERSRRLLTSISRYAGQTPNIVDLAGDAIASDPLILLDEAHSIGLFDGPSPHPHHPRRQIDLAGARKHRALAADEYSHRPARR